MTDIKSEKTITFPDGRTIPAIGLGMWYFGEDAGSYYKELKTLRHALDIGYRVFDTAEMYGEGGAEEVLGAAVADCRKDVFLTSKVSPESTAYEQVIEACEKSLDRLNTDYLDLYLLHWRLPVLHPEEILEAFSDLKKDGRIRDFGVSHFDAEELNEWYSFPDAEENAVIQSYFNLLHRGPETDLLPLCAKKKIPLVAYAPLDLYPSAYNDPVLREIADEKGATPRQIALAWVLDKPNVGVLIKSQTEAGLRLIYQAQFITLSDDEIRRLDSAFPLS